MRATLDLTWVITEVEASEMAGSADLCWETLARRRRWRRSSLCRSDCTPTVTGVMSCTTTVVAVFLTFTFSFIVFFCLTLSTFVFAFREAFIKLPFPLLALSLFVSCWVFNTFDVFIQISGPSFSTTSVFSFLPSPLHFRQVDPHAFFLHAACLH